jgi:hypothetical protein
MKKIVVIFAVILSLQTSAQEINEISNSKTKDTSNNYNQWTIEGMFGISDDNRPYGIGFNSGEKKTHF